MKTTYYICKRKNYFKMAKIEQKDINVDKTKVAMSIPQWIALLFFIFSVGGGFAVLGEQTSKNTQDIKDMQREKAIEMQKLFDEIQRIRESQIRMEGKLDLKQDKFSK